MHVLSRVSRLARHLDIARRSAFASHGLETWEFDVLSALRRVGPPFQLTPGALLRATLVTSGTMTNRIDRLAEAGLVHREPDPRDRRGVLVTLTDEGKARVDAALADLLDERAGAARRPRRRQRTALAAMLRILLAPLDAADQYSTPRRWRPPADPAWPWNGLALKSIWHICSAPRPYIWNTRPASSSTRSRSGSTRATASASSAATATASPACCACSPGSCSPTPGRVTRRSGVRVGVLDQADTLDGDAHRRARDRRRPARTRVGRRPARPRRRSRGLVADIPWDAPRRHAQRWAAPPGRARRAADRRLGRHLARRADQPPRRRGHHLARRAPQARAGPRTTGGLLVVTHDRWFLDEVCTPRGRCTTGSSSRSRAATRPTSCSGSSATGRPPPARPSGRT